MFQSSTDEAAKLEMEIQQTMSNVGGDKVSIDLGAVAALVRRRRRGAEQFVETLCAQANQDNHRLQMAQLVALGYATAFDDQRLLAKVTQTANALGLSRL